MTADDVLLGRIEAVYRASFQRFYRVAVAVLHDDGLAWDAVQDGFAGAIRGRSGFRAEAPLEAWLWRAVINAAIRESKRHSDLRVSEVPDAEELPQGRDLVDLSALSERQRLVVFLRYYADLDERTIGAALGIERGTVSATLHRALKALRRDLEVPR